MYEYKIAMPGNTNGAFYIVKQKGLNETICLCYSNVNANKIVNALNAIEGVLNYGNKSDQKDEGKNC